MLKLAEIFTDHMVLCRDRETVIWGETDRTVYACLDGVQQGFACIGRFEITLPPHAAGGPHTLELKTDGECLTFKDVWFGEVWLAGGQSNMEYRLQADREFDLARQEADLPLVRQFEVPRANYPEMREEHPGLYRKKPEWTVSTPESCGSFSAVAWWYAREYSLHFGIPVGIIYCNVGGSSAVAWLSRYTAYTNKTVREYVNDYNRSLEGKNLEDYKKLYRDYYAYDARWHANAQHLIETEGLSEKEAYADPRIGPCPEWPPPSGPWHFSTFGNLYEAMLSTVTPYTLSEVIFYQGEEDVSHPERYLALLSAMISDWRHDFRDSSLHFSLVMIAPYSYNWDNPLEINAALVREAQLQAAEALENVSVTVTTDCGERYDIHPVSKRIIGERLFSKARERAGEAVSAENPEPEEICIDGSLLRVTFSLPLRENSSVTGLQLKYGTGEWVSAEGSAEGNVLFCRGSEGEKATGIRYAFADYIESNLYGENGMPAVPFRRDSL